MIEVSPNQSLADTSISERNSKRQNLKFYLTINAAFSAVSGLSMLLFSVYLNRVFNITNEFVLPIIGLNLLVFAVFVWLAKSQWIQNRKLILTISALDLSWVIVSTLAIAFQLFNLSSTGYLITGVIAAWIAFLCYKQFVSNRS